MYEVFEHTADLGLRVKSGDLCSLMAEAGEALYSVIVSDIDAIEGREEVEIRVEFNENELLLVDWLTELIYLFESRLLLLREFEVAISGDPGPVRVLTAVGRGEVFDSSRHQLDNEVKAITYHGLRVEEGSDGWLAEVIVDI